MRDRIDSRPITILKIGGSLLTETDGFGEAVAEVRAHVDRGHDVVAVVSAMNGTTDRLWAAAHELAERPDAKLLSSLLATGEDAAAALFGIALRQAPTIEAAVLSALELGLVTEGPDLDATPVAIDANRIRQLLRTRGVVVAPGFVGRSAAGDRRFSDEVDRTSRRCFSPPSSTPWTAACSRTSAACSPATPRGMRLSTRLVVPDATSAPPGTR